MENRGTVLLFWLAKISFELGKEKEAYRTLKLLSHKPFENYYTAKASISLIANKMEVEIPNSDSLISIIEQQDHTDHILGYHLNRVLLINDVFGQELARKEMMSLSWNDFQTIEELQHALNVYEKLGLFHLAFKARKRIQFRTKQPVNSIWERIKIGFPLYYDEAIEENAEIYGIESELVHAIMYRESLFQHDAVSVSDAHGLLQIIPETAENISPRVNIKYDSVYDLYDPIKNISIGTYYLKRLLKKL